MPGFGPIAAMPITSNFVAQVQEAPQQPGGWFPIVYVDRKGNKVNIQDAPKQIKEDLKSVSKPKVRKAVNRKIRMAMAEIQARLASETRQRETEQLALLLKQIEEAAEFARQKAQVEQIKRLAIQRAHEILEKRNADAIAVLLLDDFF